MVRLKSRYLLVEMRFEDGLVDQTLTAQTVHRDIMQSVENTYGDYGFGCVKMTLKVKYVNPFTGVVFLKCSRDHYRTLWHSITFLKEINGRQCSMNTLHLGGTINSCQRFLIKHNKKQLQKMLSQCKTQAEREQISKMLEQLPTAQSVEDEKKKKQGDLALKHLTDW